MARTDESTARPPALDDARVVAFARLALAGIVREYPNKPAQVCVGPESVLAPRALHPVFYGCFDWHSAVHGHWMLVRLLATCPGSSVEAEMRRALEASLTEDGLAAEAEWFRAPHNAGYERTYGWAWCLRLAHELRGFDDPDAARWAARLRPLEERIVELTKAFLPRLAWPLRLGLHPDTAFALSLGLDYARAVGDGALAELIAARSLAFYGADVDYPTRYEPGGEDFFSPGLNEADLMRRVLPAAEFSAWLDGFLPGLARGDLGNLGTPVAVTDVTDGRLVHLAGLNLSRAWTLAGIAAALPAADPRHRVLAAAHAAHRDAGLASVFTGHYEGEHWLASFAVFLLTGAGRGARS